MEWRLTIKEITKACQGMYWDIDGDEIVRDVFTDSRNLVKGGVFVALTGAKFDGHNFVRQAIENGALCALVDSDVKRFSGLPVIVVDNSLNALGSIAKLYREQFNSTVIAITGSVGKTSTKDMIANVFSTTYNTLKTQGNYNNEIGLPLTLFKTTSEYPIIVLEMGMSGFGEIQRLSNIAKPDTAVITNIGMSHIEKLGSRENILKAKLEILDGLAEDGAIVLNGDDDMLYSLHGTLGFETLYYGIENTNCDISAYNIEKHSYGSDFNIKIDGQEHKIHINAAGDHHIYNALAAILVGLRYNIPLNKIIEGIVSFSPGDMRQKIIKLENYTLIEDCYNASPSSMRAGLEVLSRMTGDNERQYSERRKIAVLGDMLELGTFSEAEHRKIGAMAVDLQLDVLVAVGNEAKHIANGAADAGMEPSSIHILYNNEDLKSAIKDIIKNGDYILFKGSRGMKLEEVSKFVAEMDDK